MASFLYHSPCGLKDRQPYLSFCQNVARSSNIITVQGQGRAGQGRAVERGPLGVAAWCFPQLDRSPMVLWSASEQTFASQTYIWKWLLPGVRFYKQKTIRANKHIISLGLDSDAPGVWGRRSQRKERRMKWEWPSANESSTQSGPGL